MIQLEKSQFSGGRLDMLLADSLNDIRYEVEIMLGATDPSHIVRCLEYWDIERRRYPAYDHIAVLIAEDVTSRFLNVMSLLAGSIPLVAIQLSALQVNDSVLLNFVKVLDQRQLRGGDPPPGDEADISRGDWEQMSSVANMLICDKIAELANEIAEPKLTLKYKKARVALAVPGSFFNVVVFFPKRGFVPMRLTVSDMENWLRRLEDAGLDVEQKKGKLTLRLQPKDTATGANESLLRELIHQVIKEQQE